MKTGMRDPSVKSFFPLSQSDGSLVGGLGFFSNHNLVHDTFSESKFSEETLIKQCSVLNTNLL